MSFGFSVGDFLAVGGVILKLVDALRGTRSEYQELICELERYLQLLFRASVLSPVIEFRFYLPLRANSVHSLETALLQVEKLNGQGDQAAAIDQIKCRALTCRYPLERFLKRIQNYDKSLGVGNSAGKVKDAGKKIQYAFKTRGEANKLRNYLKEHTLIINTLLTNHGVKLLDVASEERKANLDELRSRIEDSSRELGEVRGNVEALALAISSNGSTLRNLFWTVTREIAVSLKSMSQTVTDIL